MADKKKKRTKKFDPRKKRKEILKERKKSLSKDYLKQLGNKKTPQRSEGEKTLDIRLARETKLYWIRCLTGALSAFVGRLIIGIIGWILLLWMLFFWFVFPFIVNKLLKYNLKKDEWTWKNVIKPGIGIFFFMFMIVGTVIHTLLSISL
jgi:hypothetical protein